MSEEDIAQMESQGYDVTELRAKRAKSAEEEEKERLREKEERENFKNPTNLNKLAPYLQTPRDMSTSFFKAMAGSAPWLFKDRWKRKYTEAPIVYAAVVQANTALWMPGNNDYYPAVFVFALDQKHIHDTEWLKQIVLLSAYKAAFPAGLRRRTPLFCFVHTMLACRPYPLIFLCFEKYRYLTPPFFRPDLLSWGPCKAGPFFWHMYRRMVPAQNSTNNRRQICYAAWADVCYTVCK